MTVRYAHLVGSIPAPDAAAAMRLAMEELGPLLRTLPDGETGERRNWILAMVESMRSHPDLQLVREGDWSDYDRIPRFRVRRGHSLYGATLDLGQAAAVSTALPVLQQLRTDSGRSDLAFQVGVPGDLDLALFSLGPAAGLRHRRAFTEATLHGLHQVFALLGADAVFQIEVPAELVLLAKAPRAAQLPAARMLAGGITGLAAAAPAGSRFGIHLCLGDMNNQAFGRMRDAAPLVALGNAITRCWPQGRTLEYLHLPFAAGDAPAPVEPGFYEPLRALRMPAGVRVIAGYVHESRNLDTQRRVRAMIEDRLGFPVDVSASCGLGRRTPDAALANLRQAAALCAE